MASTLRYKLSAAIRATQPPPIALAKAWGAAYHPTPSRPIIDLSQGVPGIPPPQFVLDAVGEASKNPTYCGYGPMCGDLPMREALATEMRDVYRPEVDLTYKDISTTAGCNLSFVSVIMTLAGPEDEVILPIPWYFNHQMTLQMLGINAVPLLCHSSQKFMPSVEECARLITPRTRAIVLVTPNNPTGAIYSPDLLRSFAALAHQRGIALVVDETYRDLITSGPPHRLFERASVEQEGWDWRETFIHLFSFSKSYCVPGHRLGAIVASPDILDHINTVLDCIQICPPRPIQAALHPLLPSIRPFIRSNAQALANRHELFRSILPEGWIIGSQGGYYAFVRHPISGVSALDVSMKLAKDLGVVTLPASFFGLSRTSPADDGWIRFSIANVSDENLKKVRERLLECEQSFRRSD
ncbi:hypothetical protein M422DRAFT_154683 [Sphaerobolus stellatus SS14]|nr:hypothetical protein M422DRAFT_154683 [Sphaerobolus stellatus SS14]